MGVTVLWAPHWFHSRVEQVRASKLIREGVPPSVYKYAQRSEEPIDLWIPDPPLPQVDQGDIVLHRENSTVKTIATIMTRLEDKQLLENLSENSASGEVGYLLRDLQEVEFDVDAGMIRTPVPLLPPDIFYLRSDSGDFGGEGGFSKILNRLSGRLERRRLYKLFGASESHNASLRGSLLTTAESVIEWIFDGISGGRLLRTLGFLTLLLLFGIGVIAEIRCWLTTGGELLGFTSGTCVHLFNLAFIGPATELSFALTGFLLVGVTLVAVIVGQADDQPSQTADLIISTDEETVETRGDYSFPEGKIELYEGGEQLDDDWVSWTITVRSADSVQANRTQTQKKPIEPPDGSYVIWNSLTGPAPTEGRAWHLSGEIHERNVDEFPGWLLGSDKSISWWIVADLEPRLAGFRVKLRRATGYAVSASVLGVIIQSYPWEVTVSENPWLGRLPRYQHIFYGVLAIIFTFVFIGMAWTSVGLLELIRRSRT